METGKLIRLRQFFREDGRSFIIAFDVTIPRGLHPASADSMALLDQLAASECDAILLHSGLVKRGASILAGKKPFIIKLTTSTALSADMTQRIMVDTVEHALSLGAVGVALNVFMGSPYETSMLANFAETTRICDRLGMPLIAMVNPMPAYQYDAEQIAYVCRVGAELGADVIKTDYPGSPELFGTVLENCPVPILIEESPHPMTEAGTLLTVQETIEAGGAGVMFAERVWAQPNLNKIAAKICTLVHDQI